MKNILYFLFALIILSCKKDNHDNHHDHDHHNHGDVFISISLTSPTEAASFDVSDVVSITGSISADGTIHGYSVELINTSNADSVLFLNDVHAHDEMLTISEAWTNNLSETSTVTVRITAYADHAGENTKILNRTIQCNGL